MRLVDDMLLPSSLPVGWSSSFDAEADRWCVLRIPLPSTAPSLGRLRSSVVSVERQLANTPNPPCYESQNTAP